MRHIPAAPPIPAVPSCVACLLCPPGLLRSNKVLGPHFASFVSRWPSHSMLLIRTLRRERPGHRHLCGIRWMATKRPRGASGAASTSAKRKLPTIKEPEAGVIDLGQGASVEFCPQLFPASEAAAMMQQLQETMSWEQRQIRIMGKLVMQPRLIAYMADGPELQYTYSGATLQPEPWHATVIKIKEAVERHTGAVFNSCLLNYYREGGHHLSWHSDNEKLYGPEPTIASMSFGAPREFMLRRNTEVSDKYRFWLGGGSLLVMRGTLQQHWMHCVPKRKGVEGARINLTFRLILNREGGCAAGQGVRRSGGRA